MTSALDSVAASAALPAFPARGSSRPAPAIVMAPCGLLGQRLRRALPRFRSIPAG